MRLSKLCAVIGLCLGLAACQGGPTGMDLPDHAPKSVRVGKPYTIKGKTYYPSYNPSYDQTGIASWYGPGFHGKKTANGETYDQYAMTAAHPTLPLPSLVRVTNVENGQSTIVRINDRGPFAEGRIIDLSKRAAETIGINGIAKVRVQYLPDETERYWASGNMDTMQIMAEKRGMDNENVDNALEYADYNDDSIQAQPAPIISVSSTQVAPLKPTQKSGAVIKNHYDNQDPYDNAPMPPKVAQASNDDYEQESLASRYDAVPLSRDEPINAVDPPVPRSGYAIQAGAFSSYDNALRLKEKLSSVGSSFIDPLERAGTTLYRVRVGPYSSHGEASDNLYELFKFGIKDAAVVAIE